MEDDDNCPPLADFFFYIAGDKTAYSSTLDDLFVCYTLTRGLQLESINPRRSALPLEIILHITHFAGFMDAKPDPTFTLDVSILPQLSKDHRPPKLYLSPKLSRVHLLSMARIHLVPPQVQGSYGVSFHGCCHAFGPIGSCELRTNMEKSTMVILPSLRGKCRRTLRYYMLPFEKASHTNDKALVPNHFTHAFLQDFFSQEPTPSVQVASPFPARVLFWRWWEPKF
ncbi:hypothetical protein BDV93DRAFT_612437 [Ceratobasidium sp. AG-I]|nr:hypothetical protein BDV93DRAFT_612437 [Ceratobasidium sp. AG-I]